MTEEKPACRRCERPLEWLGAQTQRVGGAPAVKIVFWLCRGCGGRFVHHSDRGWRETNVDLTAD